MKTLPHWTVKYPLDAIRENIDLLDFGKGQDYDAFALVLAMVKVESSGNKWASRYEPGWHEFHFTREHAARLGITTQTEEMFQKTCFGFGQLCGGTLRRLGYTDMLTRAYDTDTNIYYMVSYLKELGLKYDTASDLAAAYNAGSVVKNHTTGSYINSYHVDKVMRVFRELTALK